MKWQDMRPDVTRRLIRPLLLFAILGSGATLAFGEARAVSRSSAAGLPLRMIARVALPGAATRFDYESLDPTTNRLFIAHLAASEIVVFDVKTDRAIATIPNVASVHGVLAVPQLGAVYATATGTNEVVAIDARTLRVVARIPGGAYPDGMAYDPTQKKLYVSDENGDTDTVIDTTKNERVATIALDGDVGNTQYDARTHRTYVNVQTRGDLVAIDPTTEKIVARYPLSGCAGNHGLAIDDRHRKAYVACEDNAKLVVFDLASFAQTQTFAVGSNPDVLAYDDGLARLYVASESGVVTTFAADARGLRKTGEAFLANDAHIVSVDPRTHRVYFPVLADSGPMMIVMSPKPARHR